MGRKDSLELIEKERGKPMELIIPPLVNRGGQALAAEKLGVSQATISKWLKDHGYVARTSWMKQTTPQEATDIERAHDSVNEYRREHGMPSIEEEVDSWA